MRGPCERSASLPLCSDEAPAADEDEAAQLCAAAVAMQKENQFEEAASLFGQALARFPDHVETLVRFGLLLVGQRSFAKAEPLLRKAMNSSSGTAEQQELASRSYQVLEQHCGVGAGKLCGSNPLRPKKLAPLIT